MGSLILFIIFILIGVLLLFKFWVKKNIIFEIGKGFTLIGFVLLVGWLCMFSMNMHTQKTNYLEKLEEKKMLEYRLNIEGEYNDDLLNDILEFNKDVVSTSYLSNNFFTNVLFNKYYKELGVIEL